MDRGLRESLQRQLDQVPEAFALGEPAGRLAGQEYFAPISGSSFRLVPVGNAKGRRLTRNPAPGSGAAQLGLEPGDTIYLLDSLPIRMAVDVMNHHARTDVVFINVRTKRPQSGVMNLPGHTPLPADVPPEIFAANLGMHYQLMPLDGEALRRPAFPHCNRQRSGGGMRTRARRHDHEARRPAHQEG